MLRELMLVAEFHEKFDVPMRSIPDESIDVKELRLRRRLIREETDELIIALLHSNVVEVADGAVDVNYVTAGTCIQVGARPTPIHFQKAIKELIEISRKVIDDGLRFKRWDQVQVGAAMLHSTVLGMCVSLNLPYYDLLDAVHQNNLTKLGPDGKVHKDADGKVLKPSNYVPVDLKTVLINAGVIKE